MRVAFQTIGCKVNTYETEALKELFEQSGCDIVGFDKEADAYIVNTCAVTAASAAKSRKAIRRATGRDNAIVAALGCYSQLDPDAVCDIEGIDIVFGTSERARIVDAVLNHAQSRGIVIDHRDIRRLKTVDPLSVTRFTGQTRAFVKIQDGCDRFCTYCIIPYARGRQRSRPQADIVAEARALIDAGHKEIVLTGIHVGTYGHHADTLHDVLVTLSELPGLKRLRLSSIEMSELTEEIIALVAERSVIAKHLHIPLQSAASNILKKMGRNYVLNDFEAKISAVRNAMPDVALTTDVMVGFPGETAPDFELTHRAVKALRFSDVHVFPYSMRPGTTAAAYPHHIPAETKKQRVSTLMKTAEQLRRLYLESRQGQRLEVLFEVCDQAYCYGHTSEYIYLKVPVHKGLENTMCAVILEDISDAIALARRV